MTPSPRDRREPDLDPDIERAFRSLLDGADELETARLRAERLDVHALFAEPTVVTEELMSSLSALPTASPELRAYAERVFAGECRWDEIELLARTIPPEVADLKESSNFVWTWHRPSNTPPSRQDAADDDFEPPQSWLQ